jgi:hypothetical protein
MHFWQNKSITKAHKSYNLKNIRANRPKGISDEDWNAILKEEKINKLIVLDQLPKVSQKKVESKRA